MHYSCVEVRIAQSARANNVTFRAEPTPKPGTSAEAKKSPLTSRPAGEDNGLTSQCYQFRGEEPEKITPQKSYYQSELRWRDLASNSTGPSGT